MDALLKENGMTLGRILIGLLFFFSGLSIVVSGGIDGTASMIAAQGLPMPIIIAWLVTALKIFAGGALVVGYETKRASLALMIFTALTIIFYHANLEDPNLFKNLAIIGGLMYVYAAGPGRVWVGK